MIKSGILVDYAPGIPRISMSRNGLYFKSLTESLWTIDFVYVIFRGAPITDISLASLKHNRTRVYC
jgi:hypothetical protein